MLPWEDAPASNTFLVSLCKTFTFQMFKSYKRKNIIQKAFHFESNLWKRLGPSALPASSLPPGK